MVKVTVITYSMCDEEHDRLADGQDRTGRLNNMSLDFQGRSDNVEEVGLCLTGKTGIFRTVPECVDVFLFDRDVGLNRCFLSPYPCLVHIIHILSFYLRE